MSSSQLEKALSEGLERMAQALRHGQLEAPAATEALSDLLKHLQASERHTGPDQAGNPQSPATSNAASTFDEIPRGEPSHPELITDKLQKVIQNSLDAAQKSREAIARAESNPALYLSPDAELEVEAGEADTSEHSVIGLLDLRSDSGEQLRAPWPESTDQPVAGTERSNPDLDMSSMQVPGGDGGGSSESGVPTLEHGDGTRGWPASAAVPTSAPSDSPEWEEVFEPTPVAQDLPPMRGPSARGKSGTPAPDAPSSRQGSAAQGSSAPVPGVGQTGKVGSDASPRGSGEPILRRGSLPSDPRSASPDGKPVADPVAGRTPRPAQAQAPEDRSTEDPSVAAARARKAARAREAASRYSTSAGHEPPIQPEQDRLHILHASRYEVRGLLGTGGQGDVREVYDKILQRSVALKALREELSRQPHIRRAFLREARVLAQLSHPSIVPVYDLGELASGAPAYTMKRISGRSLRDILHGLRRGDPQYREFTRRRLVEILLQVAHTVGYAHHRGVVHRDLKPGNIMVGDFGEVLVVDWGIARIQGDHPVFEDDETHYTGEPLIRTNAADPTAQGTIKGTPAYMAPEQARGDNALVGPWTDVHALGLILYEILLGEPARETGLAEEVVMKAQEPLLRSPERRRVEDRVTSDPIPEELDQICMRCLSDPFTQRYPDGEALARSLRAHLEGQRRREQAELRATEAEIKTRAMTELGAEIQRLRTEWGELRSRIKSWATAAEKRPLWELEQRLQQLEHQRDEAQNLAILFYSQALDGDPDNRRARTGLSDIYYQRLIQSEHLGRVREARQFESQLRRLDDGRLRDKLVGLGTLHLDSTPDRAEVWLYRYELTDNLLLPSEGVLLGKTPVAAKELPMGRYLVVLRMRGGREVYYPIWIRRQTRWDGTVHLRYDLDDRFVHVPAGPFVFGGDRLAASPGAREERYVHDFAIARYPVTCKDYLRFLNSLPLAQATKHAPRTASIYGGKIWWTIEQEQITIPRVDEAGGRWDGRYPIRSISRRDAEAFIAWRAREENLPLRLPTEVEWEKAARGTDGRYFPWGDHFDASFCKMRDSRPGRPEPEPVGAFPHDRSPYGIHDLAGNCSEWVADAYDRYHLLGNLKGGYWRGGETSCRVAGRFASDPDEPAPFAGFRLALDLNKYGGSSRE